MGKLVNGEWTTHWYGADADGRFIRDDTAFRDRVTRDGSDRYAAQAGRYHLYVSWACPWAHRTLIFRRLKKLEDAISISIVDAHMGEAGWKFSDAAGASADSVNGAHHLHEIYVKAKPDYTGRVTVPILWDKQTNSIVNNESREIIRMLDSEFDDLTNVDLHFFPEELADSVEDTIDAIYNPINNGVYRCGFATTQVAYDEAFAELFAALDHWDHLLSGQRYLCGDRITAADWCMFTTLLRFDLVYYVHFKCNQRHIYEYPQLGPYLRDLYQHPGIAQTCNFDQIKRHYFGSHESINPTRIVPGGPMLDLEAPHDRERFIS